MPKEHRGLLRGVRALFVDAGGVLLRPDASRIRALYAEQDAPTDDAIDRALYVHGKAGAALGPGDDDDQFVVDFALSTGLSLELVEQRFEDLRDIVLFSPWVARHSEQTSCALSILSQKLERIVIVSNTEYGGVRDLLAELSICQVGEGAGVPVSLVIDSAEIGIHKPNPEIYRYVASAVGLPIDSCACVGDSIRNDVDAAIRAGARGIHFAPYGSCPSEAHPHVECLSELANEVANA
jgi:FMN phosphatase YigB (HAD superfamily)